MSSRIQQLLEFVKEDPEDPFNLYALAIEYQKSDIQKALKTFRELQNNHPGYVPTYYHLGKLYEQLSQNELALGTFETGIKKATDQNDLKALRELQAARRELLSDI